MKQLNPHVVSHKLHGASHNGISGGETNSSDVDCNGRNGIFVSFDVLRYEYALWLCYWSAFVGLRATIEAALGFFTGFWSLLVLWIMLLDFAPQLLSRRRVKSFGFLGVVGIGIFLSVAEWLGFVKFGFIKLGFQDFQSAQSIQSFIEIFFKWSDRDLSVAFGLAGLANWVVIVTLACLLNTGARFVIRTKHGGEFSARVFFRLAPLALLLAIYLKNRVINT